MRSMQFGMADHMSRSPPGWCPWPLLSGGRILSLYETRQSIARGRGG